MNKKRVVWLVLVLVMAFAMSACNSNDDGGSKGIGETFSFSDQQVLNADGTLYTGIERTFMSNAGGSGTIRGGKLSFSIGTPSSMKSMTTLLVEMDARLGFNISYAGYDPANTLAMDLVLPNLTKELYVPTDTSVTEQEIHYIYVDRDCTITAPATGIPDISYTYPGDIVVPVKVTLNTLKLKKGWNAISKILAATATSGTLVVGTGDTDSCKWVYE